MPHIRVILCTSSYCFAFGVRITEIPVGVLHTIDYSAVWLLFDARSDSEQFSMCCCLEAFQPLLRLLLYGEIAAGQLFQGSKVLGRSRQLGDLFVDALQYGLCVLLLALFACYCRSDGL